MSERDAQAAAVLKKIAAARGKLQGSFYFAADGAAATAGLIATLSARDPKGRKAANEGKKLRRSISGARFARGRITVEGGKLTLTLYTGTATASLLRKSVRTALTDKALQRLLRAATITTPEGPVEAPEEDAGDLDTTLTDAEQVELADLIAEQGPLVAQSAALMAGFLSVGEEAAERAEIVAGLCAEIAAMEAAGLGGLDALTDRRRQLALALSTAALPDDSEALPQELRHLLSLSTQRMTEAIAVFHAAAFRRMCAGYDRAWGVVSGQLDALQQALRADGDPELALIAEGGLPGLLEPHRSRLAAALAAPDPHPADIAPLAAALAAHLDSAAVAAVDDNPLGVAVGLRSQLLPALTGLTQAAALGEGA